MMPNAFRDGRGVTDPVAIQQMITFGRVIAPELESTRNAPDLTRDDIHPALFSLCWIFSGHSFSVPSVGGPEARW